MLLEVNPMKNLLLIIVLVCACGCQADSQLRIKNSILVEKLEKSSRVINNMTRVIKEQHEQGNEGAMKVFAQMDSEGVFKELDELNGR